jgi:uncharacterized protein
MKITCGNFSIEDLNIIKKQLKRRTVSTCGVFKRCRHGFPQIIFLNPVKELDGSKQINHEAISNPMWLTCPYLNYEIHELENSSYIKKIKKIIQDDVSYRDMMTDAHANYYFFRNYLFRRQFVIIPEKDLELFQNGIGGMRDLNAIKCLHLHFCHFNLCKKNIAGNITYHLLKKKTECDDARCAEL